MINQDDTKESKDDTTYGLSQELQDILGDAKLLSMTSSATNGVIITTIAYEEELPRYQEK